MREWGSLVAVFCVSVFCNAADMSWISMRRAQESDLVSVFECDAQMTEEIYVPWLCSVVPFSHTYVPQLIDQVLSRNQAFYRRCSVRASRRVFLWVFEDRESAGIAGFALCRLISEGFLLIDTLYVKPRYRRRGIVRWFVAHVAHLFPHVRQLALETLKNEGVAPGERCAAIAAYQSLGFYRMPVELLTQLRHWFPARERFILLDGGEWVCLRDRYYERLVYECPVRDHVFVAARKKITSLLWNILGVIKIPINSTRERARE